MMWKEFEELAGYEVSFKTYDKVIEPMYMALPDNITKAQFVKMLNKKAFALPTKAELKKAMRKEAEHLYEICGHRNDYNSLERLYKLAREYAIRFWGYDAEDMNGFWYYLKESYEYPALERGCKYPKELRIMNKYGEAAEVIVLVKE